MGKDLLEGVMNIKYLLVLGLLFLAAAGSAQAYTREEVVTSRQGEKYNLLLQNNDVIVVPPRTNVVRVSGEVMMAQAVMYRPGAEAEDYIENYPGNFDHDPADVPNHPGKII